MVSTLISGACLWSGIGLAAVFGFLTNLGVAGLGLGYLIGTASASSILCARIVSKMQYRPSCSLFRARVVHSRTGSLSQLPPPQ